MTVDKVNTVNKANTVDWILSYRASLEKSYQEDAWKYFEHEHLKLHPTWNGYRCSKCHSMNAVKNSQGYCIKCLVLREKIDVLDKILKQLKGGSKSET